MNVRDDVRATMRPRSTGLLLVIAAHAALGWLLVQGLGLRIALPVPTGAFEARVLAEQPTRVEPLRQPREPDVTGQTRVELPPLEMPSIEEPVDTAIGTLADPVALDAGATGDAADAPHREAASVDPRQPLTQPPYPAASVRLGEEGAVTLELQVARDGRVLEARVLQSSGFPRLDAAAIDEARRIWRLRPATEDGKAVEARYAVRVSFRLDRR